MQRGTSSKSAAASGGYPKAEDGFQWVDSWRAANQGRGAEYTAEQWKSYFMGVSKKLSYILRHGAAENGLTLRSDASIALADLLQHRNFRGVSREEVDLCVEHDAKNRFLVFDEGGQRFIRAQQGHTKRVGNIDQEQLVILITRQNCPKMAVHGTFGTNVEAIRKEGLKKMGRDHIHMATGLPGDAGVISGCREGADVFLHIDVRQAVASGIPFFLSGNDVLLTSGRDGILPPEFIRGATNASGEKVLFGFENEAPKQKLIPGMAGYVPKAAATPDLTVAPPSSLNTSEKDFLKLVKDIRAVLKIEARRDSGETIDKLQSDKLAKKDKLLASLSEQVRSLDSNSALLEKNQDVLAMAIFHLQLRNITGELIGDWHVPSNSHVAELKGRLLQESFDPLEFLPAILLGDRMLQDGTLVDQGVTDGAELTVMQGMELEGVFERALGGTDPDADAYCSDDFIWRAELGPRGFVVRYEAYGSGIRLTSQVWEGTYALLPGREERRADLEFNVTAMSNNDTPTSKGTEPQTLKGMLTSDDSQPHARTLFIPDLQGPPLFDTRALWSRESRSRIELWLRGGD